MVFSGCPSRDGPPGRFGSTDGESSIDGSAARAATGAARVTSVKTKTRYYNMRAVLAQLQFNVVKHEPHPTDTNESKVYFSQLLPTEVARGHRLTRTVVQAE